MADTAWKRTFKIKNFTREDEDEWRVWRSNLLAFAHKKGYYDSLITAQDLEVEENMEKNHEAISDLMITCDGKAWEMDPVICFIWALLMSSFSAWLVSIHRANDITFWIIQCLTEWCSSKPFSLAHTDMSSLLQAIAAKDQMGCLTFVEECIVVEWAGGIQAAHFLWLAGRRNTGK
jgi:hypothetical protein